MKLSPEDKKEFEAIFSELKNGMKKQDAIKKLEVTLKKIYKKDFTVKIIKTKERKYSFVMSVIPEQSALDKITSNLLNEKSKKETITDLWEKCNKWTIEIDERVLDNSFTDRELSALLLHEIGHVVCTDSVPTRIKMVIQYSFVSMPFQSKSILKQKMFKKMIQIPLINACVYGNTRTDLKKELKADQFSVKNGYLNELISAMTKIEQRGLSHENLSSSTDYMKKSIEMLQKRKAKLVKESYEEITGRLPQDMYMRETVNELINDICNPFQKTTYTDEWLYESVNNEIDSIIEDSYITEFLDIRKKKLKPVNQNEIDYVAMKSQDIQSIDDKIMLMSYINSKLDMIEYYLSIMDNPKTAKKYIIPNSENQLNRYRVQLLQIKKYITNYKIPDNSQLIVSWYPKGYEG